MTKKQLKEEARQDALKRLRGWLKPGDTVSTVLVARESIKVLINFDGGPFNVSTMVSRVTGHILKKSTDTIYAPTANTGFFLVLALGRALFPNGFDCVGKNCPSNDHFNGDKRKHHPDGGYALSHRWI